MHVDSSAVKKNNSVTLLFLLHSLWNVSAEIAKKIYNSGNNLATRVNLQQQHYYTVLQMPSELRM